MLSNRNLIVTSRLASEREGLGPGDEALAYLPMAWVGDHVLSYAQAIVTAFTINCPESASTVLHDLKEIGPSYFFAPPRIWESILTNVMIRIEDAAWLKRRLVKFFLGVAQDLERARLSDRPRSAWRRLLYPLGRLLVYGPLRDNLGMRRIRVAYTAGEAIGSEIFVFFRALGINVKQLYGMTEASVFVAVQKDGDVRLDTVGTPMPQVEIKISEQGEVMFRAPGVFPATISAAPALAAEPIPRPAAISMAPITVPAGRKACTNPSFIRRTLPEPDSAAAPYRKGAAANRTPRRHSDSRAARHPLTWDHRRGDAKNRDRRSRTIGATTQRSPSNRRNVDPVAAVERPAVAA